MALYLDSEQCQTSQGMYSVVASRYARAFVGLPHGWLSAMGAPPSVDDIHANLAEIEDMSSFTRPLRGVDEMRAVAEQVRAARKAGKTN